MLRRSRQPGSGVPQGKAGFGAGQLWTLGEREGVTGVAMLRRALAEGVGGT